MNNKINWMARIGMVAGIYVALTLVCYPFSFGVIQIRLSEALIFLVLVDKRYSIALIIGCLLSNLASPYLLYDILFGVSATILSCLFMILIKKPFISSFIPVIFNGLLVGYELSLMTDITFILCMIYVMIGEAISVVIVGNITYRILRKKLS